VKCVSIFSGAGGLDVGAKNAGAKIMACVENDPDAAETLRLNRTSIDNPEIFAVDIQSVDFTQLRTDEPTILIGGPPCQPFSKNGLS
jgi:DNA (cytosine-5)-methyltransferase 1